MPPWSEISYLSPWRSVAAAEGREHEAELKREVRDDHPLFGMDVEAIAKRDDQDDVLFKIVGSPRVAVVHLTWRGEQEKDSRWPFAVVFDSLDDWVEKEMKPDHEGGEAVV